MTTIPNPIAKPDDLIALQVCESFLKKKASNNLIIDTHQGTANSDDPIIVFQMAIMVTIELCVRLSSSFCPGRCK